MKKPLLSSLGLCLLGFTAQAQWVYQPIGFASLDATTLYFDAVDANTAWTVGVGFFSSQYVVPQLARTVNAGQTWAVTSLPVRPSVREDVTALAAVSPTTAWVTTVEIDGVGGQIGRAHV